MYEACGDFFFLFWLLRIKGKIFDEIKHLFGQFQMISASPHHHHN